jgi:hypothetical protein
VDLAEVGQHWQNKKRHTWPSRSARSPFVHSEAVTWLPELLKSKHKYSPTKEKKLKRDPLNLSNEVFHSILSSFHLRAFHHRNGIEHRGNKKLPEAIHLFKENLVRRGEGRIKKFFSRN